MPITWLNKVWHPHKIEVGVVDGDNLRENMQGFFNMKNHKTEFIATTATGKWGENPRKERLKVGEPKLCE